MKTLDYQAQISSLQEAIREAENVMHHKKALGTTNSVDIDPSSKTAINIEELLLSAQEEWLATEHEKATVISQYEVCKNKNLTGASYADQLRKDIQDAEGELRSADYKLSLLEKKLKNVSASYKNDRDRRKMLFTKIRMMVNALYDAVSRKVSVTTDESVMKDATRCLRMLAEASMDREAECNQWRKFSKETAIVVEMKRARGIELRKESEKAIASFAERRNRGILLLAEECDAKRCAIQSEISDLKDINVKQLEQLRSAKLTTDRSGKISHPRNPPGRSGIPADKFLEKKLMGEHDHERERLEQELRRISSERHKVVIATKALQQEIDKDAASHAKLIGQLEISIAGEKQEVASIEYENSKLRDMMDNLMK